MHIQKNRFLYIKIEKNAYLIKRIYKIKKAHPVDIEKNFIKSTR